MNKGNIILIGMPTSGKSTVGVILAKILGMDFVDTDLLIQKQSGKKLKEILAEDGLEAFLEIEEKACLSVDTECAVIATGGSAVYGRKAMEHFRQIGRIVYLDIDYEMLSGRLHNVRNRGVVLKPGQSIRDLYEERVPLYETYADLTVSERGRDMEETVQAVLKQMILTEGQERAAKRYAFGVDIGGTTVKIGLFETEGQMIEAWEIPTRTENQGDEILPDIAKAILDKLSERGIATEEVEGIGMGIPGPVLDECIVNKCINLGWGVRNVAKELADLTGITRIKAGNDANVAALGEMWKGGGAGHKNVVMVTLGTGVGGGIIVNEKIISGAFGAGGEIGHMKMSEDETEVCGCGKKGCLEQYASATGIVRMAKKMLEDTDGTSDLKIVKDPGGDSDLKTRKAPGEESDLKELKASGQKSTLCNAVDLTAKDIFDAAKTGDVFAKEVVEQAGQMLGKALSYISCVADPEVYVIGGGVSKAGDILLETIRRHFRENAFHASRDAKFALAALGNDAGMYGAVKLIVD